jgi:hypothetical protein
MTRQRLPNRRPSLTVAFWHEGFRFRATASRFPDNGRLAELFLDVGKDGTALKEYADNAAMLVSMLLQNGVHADDIRSLVTGPIQRALTEFAGIRP